MGTANITLIATTDQTITKTVLNDLVQNLATEFNGNIENINIKSDAAIAYTKLNLTSSITKDDLATSVAMSYTTSFTNATLSSGVLTVTHSLGRQYTNVAVYDNNDLQIEPDEITATSTSVTAVDLSTYGTIAGTWNVRISV